MYRTVREDIQPDVYTYVYLSIYLYIYIYIYTYIYRHSARPERCRSRLCLPSRLFFWYHTYIYVCMYLFTCISVYLNLRSRKLKLSAENLCTYTNRQTCMDWSVLSVWRAKIWTFGVDVRSAVWIYVYIWIHIQSSNIWIYRNIHALCV